MDKASPVKWHMAHVSWFLETYKLSDRLVTNAEYISFIKNGSYQCPELWLDDDWATVNQKNWQAPLYWMKKDRGWYYYTLSGLTKVNPNEPVTQVSYYEAVPLPGALSEYNGKFMCNQYVLRGGSCATSKTHIRKTYRNFFYPNARWQFNGIRLVRTVI